MRNRLIVISSLALSCCMVIFASVMPSVSSSQPLAGQQTKEKPAAPANPTTSKAAEGKPAKFTDKLDPVAERKKKAKNLLNQCYQEALESEPQEKILMLTNIARSMSGIDRERALFIYEQAFTATKELQNDDSARRQSAFQYDIVREVMHLDLEKALPMALQIERVPEDSPESDRRALALGMVAGSIAVKDPERAFGIVRQDMPRSGSFYYLVTSVAEVLDETRPDLAEILYVDAIHQFDKPNPDATEVDGFVNLTSRLFDLNRVLTGQSLDLILKAIDYLGEHPPKMDYRTESFDGKTKTSFGGIRDYVIVRTVAMMRRLDPERAKSLEEKFADYRGKIALEAAQQDLQSQPPAQAPSNAPLQNPVVPLSESTQFSITIKSPVQKDSTTAVLPSRDLSAIRAESVSRAEVGLVVHMAEQNPDDALGRLEKMKPGPYRIKALVGIAEAIYKSDPEKAKSLVKQAALETEKLPEPFDRAECDAVVAEGFLPFDEERSQQLIGEAFKIADKMAEDEMAVRSKPRGSGPLPDPRRTSPNLLPQLFSSLAKLNIEDAIARAQEIKTRVLKLRAMVQIADAILTQK